MRMTRAMAAMVMTTALLTGCSSGEEEAAPSGGTAAPSAPAPRPADSGDEAGSPSPESAVPGATAGECSDRPKPSDDLPKEMPSFEWREAENLHFPTDPNKYGPKVWPEGGVPSCFAPTPMGAVLAGMAYEDHLSNASTIEQVLSPGPRLDAYLRELGGEDRNANTAGEAITVAGYRVMEAEAPTVRIEYLMTNDSGRRMVVSPQQLRWVDDDWKIDGQVTNAELGQGREVSDPAGFTMFSGG